MKEVSHDDKWDDSSMPTPIEEFVEQNFNPANYVILARIYDLLAIISLAVSPAKAKEVLDAHEAGRLIGDPPYLILEEQDDSPPVEDTSSTAPYEGFVTPTASSPAQTEGFVTPKYQDSPENLTSGDTFNV